MTFIRRSAFAFLAFGLVLGSSVQTAIAEPIRTQTASGILVGDATDGVASYKSVPYAAAPVGERRWAPPQPVASWTGEREALQFSPACMQASRNGPVASEDCLYLNVYAPVGAKNAPVMVWIHGGSNLNGAGSIYNGAAFARDGVVTVTLNYRMGAFGFFAHPAITKASAPDAPLANYGLMDQTAALQWVQANIGAFGGDKNRVTVFGESAGAIDIYALLGLKTSRGLFNQAILQSNIRWGDGDTLSKAEEDGAALIARAGGQANASLADIRALSAEALAAAANGSRFPIVDGRFMTESSFSAMAGKRTMDIRTIVGSNSYEASLRPELKDRAAQTDWTNSMAGAPARFIARQSADGEPSWLYFFSYVGSARRGPESPGAAHASEISYVFGGAMRPGGEAASADEDRAMARLLHSCWTAFAKTGAPACESGPSWPQYDPTRDQLMEFGIDSGVRTNFRKEALDAAAASQPGAR